MPSLGWICWAWRRRASSPLGLVERWLGLRTGRSQMPSGSRRLRLCGAFHRTPSGRRGVTGSSGTCRPGSCPRRCRPRGRIWLAARELAGRVSSSRSQPIRWGCCWMWIHRAEQLLCSFCTRSPTRLSRKAGGSRRSWRSRRPRPCREISRTAPRPPPAACSAATPWGKRSSRTRWLRTLTGSLGRRAGALGRGPRWTCRHWGSSLEWTRWASRHSAASRGRGRAPSPVGHPGRGPRSRPTRRPRSAGAFLRTGGGTRRRPRTWSRRWGGGSGGRGRRGECSAWGDRHGWPLQASAPQLRPRISAGGRSSGLPPPHLPPETEKEGPHRQRDHPRGSL